MLFYSYTLNNTIAVILLPLRPASLMHKNLQRHKIIYFVVCVPLDYE